MDKRTLMLAGLITEAEYRKSKEKKPLNESNLKNRISTLIKEVISEYNSKDIERTMYEKAIKDMDYDTAYVYLEDQGLSPTQIDSILQNMPELYEAKKKKDKEEEVAIEDTEIEDTEDINMDEPDMGFDLPEPEGDSDLNNIESDLEAALEKARSKGDEKLITQIENTITMLTRMQFQK